MPNELAIWSTALAKSYGAKTALAGLELSVPAGSVFALLGPNGAGKTTAVRVLSTLARPDGGRASVAGYDIVAQRHEVRRRISLTGQEITLDALQTGRETLEMMGRLGHLSARTAQARASELLERFDLEDAADRRVGTYSGGMQRKLDLAAGLLSRPEVIFLDEPTTGLDPRARAAMWDIISAQAAAGATVLLTTQYLDEADHLAAYIVIIDEGRVIAQGTPGELKSRAGSDRIELHTRELDGLTQAVEILAALRTGTPSCDRATRRCSVAAPGGAQLLPVVVRALDDARIAVEDITLRRPTLDEVFLALTGRSTHQSADDNQFEEHVA